MTTELADLSVRELLAAFGHGDVTPTDALESCLRRIELMEPAINAVLTLTEDVARAEAETSTRRWSSGDPRPLEGVPYGLKDIIEVAGIRATGGSRLFADHVPTRSAAVAERLASAGGVLVAKLQTLELAAGIRTFFGRTNNPWDPERLAAGSSSGSAAALAARELPLTVGTDTGGSIAIPASFCGVVGLKATFGRIPRNGVMPLSWTLDHVGPMTRTAYDAALALQALAGHDRRDPTSAKASVDDYTVGIERGVDGLRIGVATDWFFDICDPQIARATHAAIDDLVSAGATTVPVDFPSTASAHPHAIELITYLPEVASLHEIHRDRYDEYGPDFQSLLDKAQFIHATDYLKALRARHLLQRDFETAFERCDVVIVPGAVSVAPRHDHLYCEIGEEEFPILDVVSRTTAIFNETGLPSLTIPTGLSSAGLPMAAQVAAAPFREADVFRVAHEFQRRTDHHLAVPPLIAVTETMAN